MFNSTPNWTTSANKAKAHGPRHSTRARHRNSSARPHLRKLSPTPALRRTNVHSPLRKTVQSPLPNWINYPRNKSSSFIASHAPSLHSSTTVPLSSERRECQTPGTRSTTAIRVPETSKKYSSQCPRTQTTVSEESLCRWMGSTVPGSTALSIRWDLSSGEFRRSRFIRSCGL